MKIGFTGTQNGMTSKQKEALRSWIARLSDHIEEIHHGDCIGADASFVEIVRDVCPNAKVVCHPPANPNKRAFVKSDTTLGVKGYLTRNRNIVNSSDILIATPKGSKEELRSGTWSTIRYALPKKTVYIFYPDGEWHMAEQP